MDTEDQEGTSDARQEQQDRLSQLLKLDSLDALSEHEALACCGELIDLGCDFVEVQGPKMAVKHLAQLHSRLTTSERRVEAHYFEGNGWLAIDEIEGRTDATLWDWDREPRERALLAFRCAVKEPGFERLPDVQRSRILTNLGNTLSGLGRFVAAIEIYAQATDADPSFGMPRANMGLALEAYAKAHYDPGHQQVFIWHALDHTRSALGLFLEPGVGQRLLSWFQRWVGHLGGDPLEQPLEFPECSLGDSPDERDYRKWCLEQRLFLNPLNDCVTLPVAARDVLLLPTMTRPTGEGTGLHGFFNQMKQEFVSARFMLYEALCVHHEAHFSDRETFQINTLDYPAYGLAVEKVRWAFRSSASILDKVSDFLAKYLGLSKAHRMSFRTLWYQHPKGNPKKGLRPEFESMANLPLRGLFWLSKDFYDTAICGELLDPDGKRLRDVRNRLEHGYVKIVQHDPSPGGFSGLGDQHALKIQRESFERLALRYIGHAREALIYLSLGVNVHQRAQSGSSASTGLALPMHLPPIEDGYKF